MHIIDRRLNPGGKNLPNRQRFLRRAPVFGDVFGVDPPRSAGLDDGQLRREPGSGQMFAITPPPLDELEHADGETASDRPQRQSERGGCFSFAVTGIDLNQTLFQRHAIPLQGLGTFRAP